MKVHFPEFARDRGLGYWMRPANIWAARRQQTRADHSTKWREQFPRELIPEEYRNINGEGTRSTPFGRLLPSDRPAGSDFRFLILGDTGEGDFSQYGLNPLIRSLKPDFMIINGDVAYPAGRCGQDRDHDDYLAGLFEPYAGMKIPIWAVPGNHEYYGEGRGREFFDIFCTRIYQRRWDESGLWLVPQPGTYWELRDPDRKNDLVVIGVDTGQTGNLDGHHDWWRLWKSREKRDTRQMNWLRERLQTAQRHGHSVILMFHIPALANQEHKKATHLKRLHCIAAEFPCVRMITGSHEHNYQYYDASTFDRYLRKEQGCRPAGPEPPHYIVCGGGGAYLTSTDFSDNDYGCENTFPTREVWRERAGFYRRIVKGSGLEKTPMGRLVKLVNKAPESDADRPELLSFLMVDVKRTAPQSSIKVTPVCMETMHQLYLDPADDSAVDVRDNKPPVDPEELERCLSHMSSFNF